MPQQMNKLGGWYVRVALLMLAARGYGEPAINAERPPRITYILPIRTGGLEEFNPVGPLAFSPDSSIAAVATTETTVRLWNVSNGKVEAVLRWRPLGGQRGWAEAFAFSPNGRTLATGHSDMAVRLWDVATGRLMATIDAFPQTVDHLVFTPDGRWIVGGSFYETARLWDVRTKRLKVTMQAKGPVSTLALAPDGKTLVTASFHGPVRLWKLPSGRVQASLPVPAQTKLLLPSKKPVSPWVSSLAFTPDGRILATGRVDGSIQLWDSASGALKMTLNALTAGMTTGVRTFTPRAVRAVGFTSDGQTLATAHEDQTVRLWDTSTGRQKALLVGHKGMVLTLAVSPDSQILATGGFDKTVRLWDISTGRPKWTLQGHTGPVFVITFTPNGQILATGSVDKTVRLWAMSSKVGAERNGSSR
jgi:WD40 repeat protein